jgi:hypothetical protein
MLKTLSVVSAVDNGNFGTTQNELRMRNGTTEHSALGE